MNNDLWYSIYQLASLLDVNIQKEDAYQSYFEENPVVFQVLGFPRFASFEKKSGNKLPYDAEFTRQLEPDFICGDPESQKVTVFELKTPVDAEATTALSNGNRVKFKAVLESHISQVAEYCEFITGNFEARSVVAKKLGLNGVSAVDGLLIYGLSSSVQVPEIAKLAARRNPPFRILSFDKVLIELLKAYAIGRNDTLLPDANGAIPEIAGMTFVAHAVLCGQQRSGRAYLFDIGNQNANRLSIYLENGLGAVEIIDSKGKSHVSNWKCSYDEPFYLRVSVSDEVSHARSISVFVDNTEVEFRQSLNSDDFRIGLNSAFIGSDLLGQNGARFRLMENYITSSVLSWRDRVNTFRYFLRQTSCATGCAEFCGDSYLCRPLNDAGLSQVQPGKAPRYREYFTDTTWGFRD